jgi:hypothetical protein
MAIAHAAERRLLSEDEREPILRSHFPILETLDREGLQDLARWLRERRDRARDLVRDGRRAGRGKAEPRGGTPGPGPHAERGMRAKKQIYANALKRVNARLDAILAEQKRARHAEKLRAVLAAKQAATPHHPPAGATARKSATAKPSRKPRPTIHGARIGSTSQAGRMAQAQRDSRA